MDPFNHQPQVALFKLNQLGATVSHGVDMGLVVSFSADAEVLQYLADWEFSNDNLNADDDEEFDPPKPHNFVDVPIPM
jgi:hypothetical protein